jgi:PAS domain S-box-containing protein
MVRVPVPDLLGHDEYVATLVSASLAAIPHPILISDGDTVLYVNGHARQMLRADSSAQVYGRPLLSFFHADAHAAMLERRELVIDAQQPLGPVPSKIIALDRSVVSVSVRLCPVEFDGRTCGMALVRLLRPTPPAADTDEPANPAHDAQVFEAIPEPMLIHDEDRILAANAACRRTLGATSSEQLVGEPIQSIVHPDGYAAGDARRELVSRLGVQRLSSVPVKLLRLDGSELRLNVDASVLETHGHRAFLITPSMG